MSQHLVQSTGPLGHARSGEFLNTCGSRYSAAPHGGFDGLKSCVALDETSVFSGSGQLLCLYVFQEVDASYSAFPRFG